MAFLSDLFCFVLGAEKIRTRGIRASDAAKRSAEARRERGGRQEYHAQPFHRLQACPHQGRTSCRKAVLHFPKREWKRICLPVHRPHRRFDQPRTERAHPCRQGSRCMVPPVKI